ncbi:MAG: cyclic nucleotide-binding domain-containing protein [Pseudomonadota bacterium]
MFAKVEPSKLKLLAFASDRLTYKEGQNVFLQDDAPDAAYVIIDGSADVIVSTEQGGESKVAELGRNAFLGDMAVLCDIPRTATVRASSTLEVLKIKKEHMMEMVIDTPALTMAVLQTLVNRLAKTTKDLSEAQQALAKQSA